MQQSAKWSVVDCTQNSTDARQRDVRKGTLLITSLLFWIILSRFEQSVNSMALSTCFPQKKISHLHWTCNCQSNYMLWLLFALLCHFKSNGAHVCVIRARPMLDRHSTRHFKQGCTGPWKVEKLWELLLLHIPYKVSEMESLVPPWLFCSGNKVASQLFAIVLKQPKKKALSLSISLDFIPTLVQYHPNNVTAHIEHFMAYEKEPKKMRRATFKYSYTLWVHWVTCSNKAAQAVSVCRQWHALFFSNSEQERENDKGLSCGAHCSAVCPLYC